MKSRTKTLELIDIEDLIINPIWEYTNSGKSDTEVETVDFPVESLDGRLVGTQVSLNNRNEVWALLGNVSVDNPRLTQHFLTLSLYKERKWFHLARYFDVGYSNHGPKQLALFLDLSVDDVFPISFDLSRYLIGRSLNGTIEREPSQRLNSAEIIALALS